MAGYDPNQPRDEDGRWTSEEKWYNRYEKSWVVQRMDAEGNQVGDADYVYSKREAEAIIKEYEAERASWGAPSTDTARSSALSVLAERELSLFSTYSQRWLGGIDADARATAFHLARNNQELHRYLLQQSFGDNLPKVTRLYRVGGIEYYEESPIVSLFATLSAAESYQQRMGVDSIRSFDVPTSRIVPSGSPSGEVWVESDWLE